MRILSNIVLGSIIAALTTAPTGASVSPPVRPTFRPCNASPSSLVLSVGADQRRTFVAGEDEFLHLVLENKGPDTFLFFDPLVRNLEIRGHSNTHTPLLQEQFPKGTWGKAAGGSGYFPANEKRDLIVPIDKIVPELRAPGTYEITAILHVYVKPSNSYACIASPSETLTITPERGEMAERACAAASV
jgi:hypothetical protein